MFWQAVFIFLVSLYCIYSFEIRQRHVLQLQAAAASRAKKGHHNQTQWSVDETNTTTIHAKQVSVPAPANTQQATSLSEPKNPLTPKATVAYLTSITGCPALGVDRQVFLDTAAVLQHSIHLNSFRADPAKSAYDYAMYAFVHPNATDCQAALEHMGYTVSLIKTVYPMCSKAA